MASIDDTTKEIFQELRQLVDTVDPSSSDAPTKLKPVLDKICTTNPLKMDGIECHPPLSKLLSSKANSELKTIICKAIAEVSKNNAQREQFTNTKIIPELLQILSNAQKDETQSVELTIQACRALGNLCYENQKTREMIRAEKGDVILFNLLDIKRPDGEKIDADQWASFIKTRCGIISNYLVGSEDIATQAVELKLVQKIHEILKICMIDVEKNEDLLLNILPPLSILTELTDLNLDAPFYRLLIQVLAKCTNPDLGELCLELLQCQAENDDVKYVLAKEGLCDTLYILLEKYKDVASSEEGRALMKLACDLIVLILNGDDAMHYLYTTDFLKDIEKWLDAFDMDLLTSGVLAIGNFARTDSHCTDMVERGVMKKLIGILSKNNGADDDMRLQHALLSALRNLVIPKPNKAAVVSDGLVETILPMLEIHQPPVVFKLLGTLRMTIDGQEKLAMELLENEKLIRQLITWSKTIDYHAGVSAESLRLIAWLIKHAYKEKTTDPTSANEIPRKLDTSSIRKFVAIPEAVDSMVGMLTSSHVVMQNEALIALCILSVLFCHQSNSNNDGVCLDDILIQCSIGDQVSQFITKNADTMTKEIVENLQTLIQQLRRSEKLGAHLNQFNIDELIKSIPSLTEYCTL